MNPLRFLARHVARIPAVRAAAIATAELPDVLHVVSVRLQPEQGSVAVEVNGGPVPEGVELRVLADVAEILPRRHERKPSPLAMPVRPRPRRKGGR